MIPGGRTRVERVAEQRHNMQMPKRLPKPYQNENGVLVKPCARCKQTLPVEQFYFVQKRNGYTARCRECTTISQGYSVEARNRINALKARPGDDGQIVKLCPSCGEVKSIDAYSRARGACKECVTARGKNDHEFRAARQRAGKAYRARNAEKIKEHQQKDRYRRKYGLSFETVELMRTARDFCCDICGERANGERQRRLNVDHCHDTGVVRGFLCPSCNKAIGLMADDSTRLRAAAAYLERACKKQAA